MKLFVNSESETSALPPIPTLSDDPIELVGLSCVHCGKCVQECGFLQGVDTPGHIAARYLAGDETVCQIAYSCSLCSLCVENCPTGLPVPEMFLALRRQAVEQGMGTFREHRPLLFYEMIGNSKLFTRYFVPAECDTVYFPGCALPGIRTKKVIQLFHLLRSKIPNLGLVLDCCNKPSHDLGFQDRFASRFAKKMSRLKAAGVKKVITTCPSCYQIFKEYGDGIEIMTPYTEPGIMFDQSPEGDRGAPEFAIHDPCVLRFEEEIQQAVRTIVLERGGKLQEMDHNRRKTFCCGEGGGAGFLRKEDEVSWAEKRKAEAGDSTILTYCAGCTSKLGKDKTLHLIDLLFPGPGEPEKPGLTGSAPFTYLNRLYLKFMSYFLH